MSASEGTRYVVVAALAQGEREVRSCGSMTEAILFGFEVEAACLRGRVACPPLRTELRAPRVDDPGVDEDEDDGDLMEVNW